jgi:hypothetical protein
MSNNKQSSVEWLEQELKKIPFVNVLEVFEQAKAMHKKEIITAHSTALPIEDGVFTAIDKAQSYYNETFGGNNDEQ